MSNEKIVARLIIDNYIIEVDQHGNVIIGNDGESVTMGHDVIGAITAGIAGLRQTMDRTSGECNIDFPLHE